MMPIETRLIDGGRGVLIDGRDIIEANDILLIKQGYLDEPDRLKNILYWLVDFSLGNELRISEEEMTRLVETDQQLARTIPNSMVAVAAATDSIYGYSRIWEVKMERVGWATSVFRNVADAQTWIFSRLASSTVADEISGL